MKTTFLIITLLILLIALMGAGCTKDKDEILLTSEGYIVGYNPCTIGRPSSFNVSREVGYFIISEDLKDTLLTYNLSHASTLNPAIIVFNSDTLYVIPALYFDRESPFFPDSLRYKYKVKISYSIANEDEKVYLPCQADIGSPTGVQVIIKSASKN